MSNENHTEMSERNGRNEEEKIFYFQHKRQMKESSTNALNENGQKGQKN